MNIAIDKAMQQAIVQRVFPAAELLVAKQHKVIHHQHYGNARKSTFFDIASLTKPICTATLAALFIKEKVLKPSDTIHNWLGVRAAKAIHKKITIEHLLNHKSGLPAWQPFYQGLPLEMIGSPAAHDFILEACLQEETIEPIGTKTIYSDIGYIILGEILVEVGNETLSSLFTKKVSTPFKLADTFFNNNSKNLAKKHFAPTEDCPWRKRVLQGEVDDQHAAALGGTAGHAGLFSKASDIHQFFSTWLKMHSFDFAKVKNRGDAFLDGWNLPSKRNSTAGSFFSKNSIGHLGYTGCSIWSDLEKDCWIILLSNRVNLTSTNKKIQAFRPAIHDLVMQELIL